MSKFGDFSAEAYEALRQAYADTTNNQPVEEEQTGYDLAGQNYKLETIDARPEYLKETGLWQYPDGTTDYEKPDPDTLITALQEGQGVDALDDEELDALVNEIMATDIDEVETDDEFGGHDGESAAAEAEEAGE